VVSTSSYDALPYYRNQGIGEQRCCNRNQVRNGSIIELESRADGWEVMGDEDRGIEGQVGAEDRQSSRRQTREVLDFVADLCTLETLSDATPAEAVIDPATDPVLAFIGGASHGSLARDIDEELYGASV
jgi:hypothetical protein